MKVFVTGHKGFIGSHLIQLLKSAGHHVAGCDIGFFEGCECESIEKPDKEYLKDFRSLDIEDLQGYDCLMHLAALSNDPMGNINPQLTYDINEKGTVDLAVKSKKAGIPLFLFASSCSIYGKGSQLDLDENHEVAPLTPYAASKINAEVELQKLADEDFSPVCLRNATAYGYSPMLRMDLVANNFLGAAVSQNCVKVLSDGTSWRPLIHCKDIARVFIAFMNAPRMTIHNKVVNVGHNAENYKVSDILSAVKNKVPSASTVYTGEVGNDPRNYRVKFDLLSALLPSFSMQYTLESGLNELHQKLTEMNFNQHDFLGDKFVRLKILSKQLHKLLAQ